MPGNPATLTGMPTRARSTVTLRAGGRIWSNCFHEPVTVVSTPPFFRGRVKTKKSAAGSAMSKKNVRLICGRFSGRSALPRRKPRNGLARPCWFIWAGWIEPLVMPHFENSAHRSPRSFRVLFSRRRLWRVKKRLTRVFELNYVGARRTPEASMIFRRGFHSFTIPGLFCLVIGLSVPHIVHGNPWGSISGFLLGLSVVLLVAGLFMARRCTNSTTMKSS